MAAYYLVLTTGLVFDSLYIYRTLRDAEEADPERLWNGEIFDAEDKAIFEQSPLASAKWIEINEEDQYLLDLEGNILRYDGPHDEPW